MEPQEVVDTQDKDLKLVESTRPTEAGADEDGAVDDKSELKMTSTVTKSEEQVGDVPGHDYCKRLGCDTLTRSGHYCTKHMVLPDTPHQRGVCVKKMDSHADVDTSTNVCISNQTNNVLGAAPEIKCTKDSETMNVKTAPISKIGAAAEKAVKSCDRKDRGKLCENVVYVLDPKSNSMKHNLKKVKEIAETAHCSKSSDTTEKCVSRIMEKTPETTVDSQNDKKDDAKEKSYEDVQSMEDTSSIKVKQSPRTVETADSEKKAISMQHTRMAAKTAEDDIKKTPFGYVESAEDTASISMQQTRAAKNDVMKKLSENAESADHTASALRATSQPKNDPYVAHKCEALAIVNARSDVRVTNAELSRALAPMVEPDVAHILDFSSDAYASDFREKKDTINLPLFEKFKQYVLPPDPRPLIGCIWCGGRGKHPAGVLAQIKGETCPACQYFADLGWKRVYYAAASKTIFMTPEGEKMNSIRDFLQESTKILCSKLGGMNVDETVKPVQAAKKVTKRRRKRQRQLNQSIILPIRERIVRKRKQIERYTDCRKIDNTPQQVEDEKELLQLSSKKQKQDITKAANRSVGSQQVDTALITRRKAYVCGDDPRPIPDCYWCERVQGTIICDTCQIFVDMGMTRVHSLSSKKTVFRDKDGQKLYDSTIQYLAGTTKLACKILKSRPNNNKKDVRIENINLPDAIKNQMKKAKRFVTAPDMRPTFGCSICGPKNKDTECKFAELIDGDICPTCKLCLSAGWTFKAYSTSKSFKLNGLTYSGVNQYLTTSSPYVCQEMESMSLAQLDALKPRYRHLNKSPSKSVPSAPSKSNSLTPINGGKISTKKEASTPKKMTSAPIKRESDSKAAEATSNRQKATIIELPTITQLLEQETGLMGVLQSDVFQVFNTYFGSNQTIASPHSPIPACVLSDEIPFHRGSDLDAESAQYIGVVRMSNVGSKAKYGVAIPEFYVDLKTQQDPTIEYIVPRETKINEEEQILLIRDDLSNEEEAGKLFAFMYRICYGSSMVASVIKKYNAHSVRVEKQSSS